MIKLLVLDLDGTLFNSEVKISERNQTAILNAQKMGVRVAIASGRSHFILQEVIHALKLDELNGFVIGNNGQDLMDFQKQEFAKKEKVKEEACRTVLEIAVRENLEVFGHDNQESFFYSPKNGYKLHPHRLSQGYNEETHTFDDPKDMDKIGLFFAVERDDCYRIAEELSAKIQDIAQVLVINPTCIELVPPGMDKVVGVDAICKRYGYTKEEVLILGDGQNDLQMAKSYPFVAMANALEEVKKAALRLTLSNDEDGVAHEIEKTILGGKENVRSC